MSCVIFVNVGRSTTAGPRKIFIYRTGSLLKGPPDKIEGVNSENKLLTRKWI